MKKYIIPFVCLITSLLFSCNNKTNEEIEKEISSGVVLIQNSSYYELILDDGEKLYFSSYDEKDGIKGLVLNEDSVQVSFSYGTGFIVSEEGLIATNAHVVSNIISNEDVHKSVKDILNVIKSALEYEYRDKTEAIDKMELYCYNALYDDNISVEEYNELKQIRDALVQEKNELVQAYNEIDHIRANDTKIIYHNTVGIAYDNTYITDVKDFKDCVVKETDTKNDLALIQLKDKKTPEGKYIFHINEETEDPLENYSFMDNITKTLSEDKNSSLYMISYNLGPTLAITKEGVKHQFNMGTVSQKTKERIMYSIPTLPGSSGSPVVNRKGELVAINFAGLNNTQNFNYGIRISYLKALINK